MQLQRLRYSKLTNMAKQLMTIPKDEEIVSTTVYGGGHYWSLKYPFKHYKKPRYLIATKNAVYELTGF